ncbi:MAG: hypothetical protein NPIRA02_11520 [Nitrospirales bacterium]|nr:MAG: hypothetical protein NPIRA02_11520 [Nitrospirales bacterium]
MKPSTLFSPSLADFEISEERGFLPVHDPRTECPQSPTLERLGQQLPKLLVARQMRQTVQELSIAIPAASDEWDIETYRYANRVLSFVAHGYIWETPDKPADHLPACLAVPWHFVSRKLGRPPVLSYASYALDNWRRLDRNKPIELDNIVLIQNFLGGLDEEWFVLIHVDIEDKAGRAMAGAIRALESVTEDDPDQVTKQLWVIASAQEAMCKTLDRMPERCDPYIYYNRVRPYIHGWKDNPALPNGLVYEGVEEFQNYPQYFRGETGAQSSIIPALDTALGITHTEDLLTHYLAEMRQYMPPLHRAFLETFERLKDEQGRPPLAGYVQDRKASEPDLWKAYHACVRLLQRFRATHLDYAVRYVHQQHTQHTTNATHIGTGGTPFMTYLQKHLEETQSVINDVPNPFS